MSDRLREIVSDDSESLILVDAEDVEVGTLSKARCHDGEGILHRAFSLFIFDRKGRVLLQKRAADKRLWPGFWSNSCCSHPRAGESMDEAVHRRMEQELGLRASLRFIYKFIYQASYGDAGSEHELCWVYVGLADGRVQANETEVADWRFVEADALSAELRAEPDRFTPWFRLEWDRLTGDYADRVAAVLEGMAAPAQPT